MNAVERYADFYEASEHPRLSTHTRTATGFDVRMVRMRQGSHALDDPPTEELIVGLVLGGQTRCRWNWGDGWMETGRRARGDFGLTPVRTGAAFEVDGPHELLVLGLPLAAMAARGLLDEGEDRRPFGRLHEAYHRDPTTFRLARRLWGLGKVAPAPGAVLAGDEIVVAMLERWRALADSEVRKPARVRPLSDQAAQRVLALMQARLGARHELASLASAAGMTGSAFCRAFKARFGHSPHAHLQSLRIEAAKSALKAPDADIDMIATDLGFAHRAHFNHVFAAYVGLTPGHYRQAAL